MRTPESAQRWCESGLHISVHYNGVAYTGRIQDVTATVVPVTIPLTARSFWTACLAMNALYQKAWQAHVVEQFQ